MKAGRSRVWGVALLALIVSTAQVALANGFRNPPEGAAALGQAGGKTALIGDPSAVTHNPANLADMDVPRILMSLTFARSSADFDSVFGPSAKTDNDIAVLPNVFGAFPLADGNWVLGLGITTPYGQHTKWRQDSFVAQTSPYFAELSMVNFAPAISTRVHDKVAVGGGLNLYYSELEFRQVLPWSEMLGGAFPNGRATALGDGLGLGAHVGVTVAMTPRHRLALVYRSPFNVEYEGDFRVRDIPPPALGAFLPKSDFETEIRFPSIVSLGYGVKVTEKIELGVDVEWTQFSRYRELNIDAGRNAAFSSDIPQRWSDTWSAGFGAQWAFASPWTLRAGYWYMESPIPTSTVAPTLPDADRHVLSVGVGYTRGLNTVELAYAHSFFKSLRVRDNQEPFYNGDYDLSAQLLQISYKRDL